MHSKKNSANIFYRELSDPVQRINFSINDGKAVVDLSSLKVFFKERERAKVGKVKQQLTEMTTQRDNFQKIMDQAQASLNISNPEIPGNSDKNSGQPGNK